MSHTHQVHAPSTHDSGAHDSNAGASRAHLSVVTDPHPDASMAPHGDLECADIEALMVEAIDSAQAARTQADFAATQLAAAEAEVAHLRTERARLIALVNAIQGKQNRLADDRDSLAEQIDMLTDEITVLDQSALPEDAVLFATLNQDYIRATYRAMSRITRGPIPPAIHEAVRNEREMVENAMREAGEQALASVIRRAVRRRRSHRTGARPGRR